ncbi:oxidoreductase [Nocardioides sp. JQ2195]|uniref:WD40/YVTN/BNR-like repeat-containing protein n=1 Tax=Nocardioides sp. JQ2195 TaxID=2592334 RepID=UPI00143E4569|nr:oxidoreductase [Nocardioides sp. JQ2195]QIX28429.1 oxidoreductase [Nocardioides sp. JQ2195]
MRILLGTITLVLSALPLGAPATAAPVAAPAADPTWNESVVDADQSFRGIDAVSPDTAWIAGSSLTEGGPGRIFRSTDGGDSWQDVSPPGTEGLGFRDVEAEDASTASVLAIGPGEASRIYRTTDGGVTWTETFRNTEETAFYNCMDFYPGGKRGLAVSDPVDGTFRILATDDGGQSWEVLSDEGMPDSTGEFNYSASGDCLVIKGRSAWFGSGGDASHVFHSTDFGRTWEANDSTIPAGEAAGVFGLAFRTPREGIAVGGDFAAPTDGADATARTSDASEWSNAGDLARLGEDAAWIQGHRDTLVVVGESGDVMGSSISRDGGLSWEQFAETGFHTLDCVRHTCWAAGGNGRVATLRLR